MIHETRTAWDLIGFDRDGGAHVRIKGGRALYEAVIFHDSTRGDQVKLARLEATAEGLRQVNRYVDPDTVLEIVELCDCMSEEDPITGFPRIMTHSSTCRFHPEY